MVLFNEEKVLVGQYFSHHGMFEIYIHLAAGMVLFLVSLISIFYLYRSFRGAKIEWPGLLHGFFYTGLIGLGEVAEHLFRGQPFLNTSFHYLHYLAAPSAMIFFYLGINEYYYRCSHPDEELHTISNEVAMGVFAGIFTLAVMMGGLAETPWDQKLEGPFLIITIIPLLVITGAFINTTRKIKKSMLAFYFPAFGIALSALAIDIWIGRFADLHEMAILYISAHSLQDILHAATATLMVLFVLAIKESIREDVIYECAVTEKAKLMKKAPAREFDLTEQ